VLSFCLSAVAVVVAVAQAMSILRQVAVVVVDLSQAQGLSVKTLTR
jgi:hypothetical protein